MRSEWKKGEYEISADKSRLDLGMIHSFLSGSSYWAAGIPFDIVRRSIENSLAFGIYTGSNQVGFARVITDYATFAYLGDVFVLEEHRGKGLTKWLMEVILDSPVLQGLRLWLLATRDAHGLYRQFGFCELRNPERYMEIRRSNIYQDQHGDSASR
jgi:GNAT superfamily N-acetyltransferase